MDTNWWYFKIGIELKPEGNIGLLLKAKKYYEEYMLGTPYFYVLNLIVEDAVDALDKTPTELVSGHGKHNASGIVGISTLSTIVKEMDDDVATILMVNSVRP